MGIQPPATPLPTLKDLLNLSSCKRVTPTEYQASKTLDPSWGSSWALWGERTDNLTIFADAQSITPRLRKDIVLIGANYGMTKTVSANNSGSTQFQNFHVTSSDTRLRNAVRGTPLEGAFLTDLVKDFPTANASSLIDLIKAGSPISLCATKKCKCGGLDIAAHVEAGFYAEQRKLNLSHQTLYIPIGKATRVVWDFLQDDLNVIPANQRVFHKQYGGVPSTNRGGTVENLAHYSNAVDMVAAVKDLLAQRRLSGSTTPLNRP